MKRFIFIAALAGGLFMLGGIMVCPSYAEDGVFSIPDVTDIQNWVINQPCPVCSPPDGWCDVVGYATFETYNIEVEWQGSNVLFHIYTDFPEEGFGNGTAIGYPDQGEYQAADLAIDLNLDGVWETGIALVSHGPIPFDPSKDDYTQPPGYGLDADEIGQGKIYSVASWFTSGDIHLYHGSRGGLYDKASPKIPIAWMRKAAESGLAQVSWTPLGPSGPAYRIDVLLENVNASGQWNAFKILWGTANCDNDVIAGEVCRPPCGGPSVPAMTDWGMVVLLAGMGALGVCAVLRRRRHAV